MLQCFSFAGTGRIVVEGDESADCPISFALYLHPDADRNVLDMAGQAISLLIMERFYESARLLGDN